jgi:hypothetical protein
MATDGAVTNASSRGDDLDFDRLFDCLVPVEQLVLDRPEKEKHGQYEDGGEDRRDVEAEADGHPDGRHHPDRSRGGQAVDLIALAKDRAGPEEADARYDLRGDAGRVGGGAENFEAQA